MIWLVTITIMFPLMEARTSTFRQRIQVPSLEVLCLIRPFTGWGFPYISRTRTAYIRWGFLHFRYLKSLLKVMAPLNNHGPHRWSKHRQHLQHFLSEPSAVKFPTTKKNKKQHKKYDWKTWKFHEKPIPVWIVPQLPLDNGLWNNPDKIW